MPWGTNLALDKLIDEVLVMKVQGEGYAMLLDSSGLIVGTLLLKSEAG